VPTSGTPCSGPPIRVRRGVVSLSLASGFRSSVSTCCAVGRCG
jgi:hypothetical protein